MKKYDSGTAMMMWKCMCYCMCVTFACQIPICSPHPIETLFCMPGRDHIAFVREIISDLPIYYLQVGTLYEKLF